MGLTTAVAERAVRGYAVLPVIAEPAATGVTCVTIQLALMEPAAVHAAVSRVSMIQAAVMNGITVITVIPETAACISRIMMQPRTVTAACL